MQLDALTGQLLAGRYRIESELGRGGMGAVFRAHDETEGRAVALKVLLPSDAEKRFLPRLMREARLAAKLRHEHVVRVFDHGRWGDARRNFFLAMELVEGATLEGFRAPYIEQIDSAASDARMHAVFCDVAVQLLSALAHVHARGVLHRDIKPENVLVTRRADATLRARLVDFGLAAATGVDEGGDMTRLTREGSLLGTPAYMAPEQVEGASKLGPSVDLYATGVLLYEMLSGRLPFEGTLHQMLVAKVTRDPKRLDALVPGLAEGLEDVVARLIARRPEDRFRLAADALEALAPFAERHPLSGDEWVALTGRDVTPEADDALAPTIADETLVVRPSTADGEPGGRGLHELPGRERELEQLEALARRVESGQGQVALIMGSLGIGKSTLIEHFAIAAHEAGRFNVMRGKTPPSGNAIGCVRAALDDWFGTQGEGPAGVERAARAMLQRHGGGDDPDEVQALTALLRPHAAAEAGLDSKRAYATFIRALRRLARERPLLVVLDDLAPDASTGVLLELLLFELDVEAFPVLFALSLRSPGDDDALRTALVRTAASEGRTRATIDLAPLEVDVLAQHLEARHGLSPRVAERTARRAGGNPLFAEQLAEIQHTGDTTASTERPSAVGGEDLPSALKAILDANLEDKLAQLPDQRRARQVLEHAAVLGEQVEVGLLESLLGEDASMWLDEVLDSLIEIGLLADVGIDDVAFSHGLLRDVVLARLSRRRGRRIHRRAATVRLKRGRPEELGVIGWHFASAGDVERALETWVDVWTRAKAHGDRAELTTWGARALELLDADDPRRGPLTIDVARAMRADAELATARSLLAPLLDGADVDVALRAGEILCEIAQEEYDVDQWRSVLERMRPRVPEAGRAGRAAWHRTRAFWLNAVLLDCEEGCAAAMRALELTDDVEQRLTAAARVTFAATALGKIDTARIIAESIEDEVREQRPHLLPRAQHRRLLVALNCGDIDTIERLGPPILEGYRRVGSMAERVAGRCDYATGLLLGGKVEMAVDILDELVELADRFGLEMEKLRAWTGLTLAEDLGGRPPEIARELADYGKDTREAIRLSPMYGICWAYALSRVDEWDLFAEALSAIDFDAIVSVSIIVLIMERVGRRLLDRGERAQAHQLLEAAHQRWRTLGIDDRAAACQNLLSTIDCGDAE